MAKSSLSLSVKMLIGVFSGVLVALFFGDRVAWLSIVGDVFIGLLQMTVLPYIMFSLIVNIGRLNMETGKKLIKYGAVFLALLLGLGLVGLLLLPLAFPVWDSGNFYSSDFIAPAMEIDFVKLYIPANPFESLTGNVVPAVVLFSIFLGLGVLSIKDRETLLKPLDVLTQALNQVNKMVVKFTPYGVFAIAAGVVTELSLNDLARLQGYLIIYLVAVVLFTFVVLPFIINIFTPFSSRKVLKSLQSTLLTIFATGKIIVVFPQLINDIKVIVEEQQERSAETDQAVDLIMPLAYPFPNLGTFLIFVFVPFAAWFSGVPLTASDQPVFLSSTLLNSFVAPITGLPFSLDVMNISQDTFQLFVVSNVLTDRVRVVLGAFHLVALTLLTLSALEGWFKFKPAVFVKALVITLVIGTASILCTRQLLKQSLKNVPTNAELFNQFALINEQQPFDVELDPGSNSGLRRNESVLSRIKRTGVVRIGFYRESMPFAFVNTQDKFVGYGVDLAHRLAADLGVKILFVPIAQNTIEELFDQDVIDIVMSDIFLSNEKAQTLALSEPYLDVSLALLVKNDFKGLDSFEQALELDSFNISYFRVGDIADEFLNNFPNGKKTEVLRYDDFFDSALVAQNHIDAFMTSAERASDLTILHPDYKVVNPLPYRMYNSLVFPVANDLTWLNYINRWVKVRNNDGTFDRVYRQWILGIEDRVEEPTWSVLDKWILNKE